MKANIKTGFELKEKALSVSLLSDSSLNELNKKKVLNELEKLIQITVKDEALGKNVSKSIFTKIVKNSAPLNLLVIGLGKEKELTLEKLRRSVSGITSKARELSLEEISLEVPKLEKFSFQETFTALSEGLILGSYLFDKYKNYSKDEPKKEVKKLNLIVSANNSKTAETLLKEVETITANVFMVRNLQNDNADEITPLKLEQVSKDIAKKFNLKITVLTEKELKKLGMNLVLAVNQGSKFPPRTIILEFNGNPKSKEVYAIVGKGITFDSGGLNLKPTGYIETMRMDMSGAAIVLGTIKTLAELKVKVNVIAALTATENLIGKGAYKPGDVFRAFNGKTVEIGNTDAEGRLILADTLAYLEKNFKPDLFIDLATLTGAIRVALGDVVAGMFGNSKAEKAMKELFEVGEKTGERVWQLPLYEEFKEDLKSDFADITNSGKSRTAGSINGALFLQEFVGETPWIHLDIAGTAMPEKPLGYVPKNGSGWGVRLLTEFFKEKQK